MLSRTKLANKRYKHERKRRQKAKAEKLAYIKQKRIHGKDIHKTPSENDELL
jgi:hypothetical protein